MQMVEELNMDGLEDGGVREQAAETSEAELANARSTIAQAKQIKTQIQQLQQQNIQFAWMLSMILTHVNDDKLLQHISRQLGKYEISIPAIFSEFLPYIKERADLSEYLGNNPELAEKTTLYDHSLTGLVSYINAMKIIYPELINYTVDLLASFVSDYAEMIELVDRSDRDELKNKEFLDSLCGQL